MNDPKPMKKTNFSPSTIATQRKIQGSFSILICAANVEQMISSTTSRSASRALVHQRNFATSRIRYREHPHYPEGPRSNIPFDPLHKYFAFKFWGFCGTSAPCYVSYMSLIIGYSSGIPPSIRHRR